MGNRPDAPGHGGQVRNREHVWPATCPSANQGLHQCPGPVRPRVDRRHGPRGHWPASRRGHARGAPCTWITGRVVADVARRDWGFPARDGHEVPLRVYRPTGSSEPLPVLVYFHGGRWVRATPACTTRCARSWPEPSRRSWSASTTRWRRSTTRRRPPMTASTPCAGLANTRTHWAAALPALPYPVTAPAETSRRSCVRSSATKADRRSATRPCRIPHRCDQEPALHRGAGQRTDPQTGPRSTCSSTSISVRTDLPPTTRWSRPCGRPATRIFRPSWSRGRIWIRYGTGAGCMASGWLPPAYPCGTPTMSVRRTGSRACLGRRPLATSTAASWSASCAVICTLRDLRPSPHHPC